MCANPRERFSAAKVKNHRVANRFAWDTGSNRYRARSVSTSYRLNKHFIKHSVIGASKEDGPAPARYGARDAESRDYRFGPSVAERHSLVSGHLAKQFGNLSGQSSLRPDLKAFV